MVNPYAYQNSLHSYYDLGGKGPGFNFFEDALPDSVFFDEADALPDEVFEEAERFADESETEESVETPPDPKPLITPTPILPAPVPKPSDYKHSYYQGEVSDEIFDESIKVAQNTQPDRIENVTGQIFLHLISFADGTRCDELEAALTSGNTQPSSPKENKSHTHRFRPFERETYFSDFDLDQQPVHAQHVLYNILGAVTQIFLGWQLSAKSDERTVEEMKKDLKRDFLTWNKVIKQHYADCLRKQMEVAFDNASCLLEIREADEKWALWQRITFYSSLTSLGVSTLAGKHTFMVLSGLASSITVIFMIIHYGNSSFKQSQLASDLKTLLETTYSGAHKYRISPQTMDNPSPE
jgi:hypothetical protein